MAPGTGFEPATNGLGNRCNSYLKQEKIAIFFVIFPELPLDRLNDALYSSPALKTTQRRTIS